MPTNTNKPRAPETEHALERAGGITKVAEALGLSRMAVWKWRVVPKIHVRAVAKLARMRQRDVRPKG